MDQATYTQLSGKTVSATRFDAVAELAKARLECMLGWPLDPSDWDNQYIESGIALNDCSCPTVDANLDPPDEVVNSYRLFTFRPTDTYIAIDPATAIHAVKLVRGDVTYRVLDTSDYRIQWQNSTTPFTRYLMAKNQCACYCLCTHWEENYTYQIAIDADWAFDELPALLNQLYVELISDGFDSKSNIKSESITSHSYTKFDKQEIELKYASILSKYAGPNGTLRTRVN